MIGRENHMPLTAEERALAQRLAQLGAAAEPAPALDARIVAAARTATAAPGRASPRPGWQRRWPVGLGLAASLALAVGVAWQLRPLPDAGIEYSEAPAATARQVPRAAAPAIDDDALPDGMQRQGLPTPAPQPTKPVPDEASRTRQTAARREAAAVEAVAQPLAAAEPALAGTPAGASPTAAPPAPAPPPAPAAPTPSQQDRQVLRSVDSQAQKSAAAHADAAAAETGPYSRDETLTSVHDEPYDDQPPASVDSPEVRKAWLARIRELVSEGRLQPARDSLQEFRRRYPQAPVPEDLQPLLD
jgi:hypothetical protein